MTANVFFPYSHKDEALRDQAGVQLSLLKRQGMIETWHDRRIGAGAKFVAAIDSHVEEDDIVLLLVSADFIASDYCYDIEMKRAMERHEAGEAIIIPVILRACDWHEAPFGKLNAAPPDGKPITHYPDRDQAPLEVAKAVRSAAGRLAVKSGLPDAALTPAGSVASVSGVASRTPLRPRSSNLALAKAFADRDKDLFRRQSFEYMALFFEVHLLSSMRVTRGWKVTSVVLMQTASRPLSTSTARRSPTARSSWVTGSMEAVSPTRPVRPRLAMASTRC